MVRSLAHRTFQLRSQLASLEAFEHLASLPALEKLSLNLAFSPIASLEGHLLGRAKFFGPSGAPLALSPLIILFFWGANVRLTTNTRFLCRNSPLPRLKHLQGLSQLTSLTLSFESNPVLASLEGLGSIPRTPRAVSLNFRDCDELSILDGLEVFKDTNE